MVYWSEPAEESFIWQALFTASFSCAQLCPQQAENFILLSLMNFWFPNNQALHIQNLPKSWSATSRNIQLLWICLMLILIALIRNSFSWHPPQKHVLSWKIPQQSTSSLSCVDYCGFATALVVEFYISDWVWYSTYAVHNVFLYIPSDRDSGHHCMCLHSYIWCCNVALEKKNKAI